ncbi:hypothetical protein BDAP_001848 [Binucleata daphniae]
MENLEFMIKQLNNEKNNYGKREKAKQICQTIINFLKENPNAEKYAELQKIVEDLLNYCEMHNKYKILPKLSITNNKKPSEQKVAKTLSNAEILVIGMKNVKNKLEEAIGLPLKHPELFEGKRKPPKKILLYGPPGTGKTHVITSLAKFNLNITTVTASNLFSKYQGESEKQVAKIFTDAFAMQPSLIFIDEIDFLCRTREENSNESSNRIKSELLININQIENEKNVFLIGATNFPWLLDSAFIRRFCRKIYVGLPDLYERCELIKYFLHDKDTVIMEEEYNEVAAYTKNFSNSDIKQLCERVLSCGVSDLKNAECFYKENNKWKMCKICNKNTKCVKNAKFEYKNSFNEIDGVLESPVINYDHFLRVKECAKSTVAVENLVKFDQWTKKYGE